MTKEDIIEHERLHKCYAEIAAKNKEAVIYSAIIKPAIHIRMNSRELPDADDTVAVVCSLGRAKLGATIKTMSYDFLGKRNHKPDENYRQKVTCVECLDGTCK